MERPKNGWRRNRTGQCKGFILGAWKRSGFVLLGWKCCEHCQHSALLSVTKYLISLGWGMWRGWLLSKWSIMKQVDLRISIWNFHVISWCFFLILWRTVFNDTLYPLCAWPRVWSPQDSPKINGKVLISSNKFVEENHLLRPLCCICAMVPIDYLCQLLTKNQDRRENNLCLVNVFIWDF